MSHEAIRDAILSMDAKVLNPETLPPLIKCVPTSTEVDTVKAFDGDVSMLGNTEKFFYCLQDIPNIVERLELWSFKQNFEDILRELRTKLKFVTNATLEIRTSKRFRQVLEILLAIGNYLNGGSSMGQAYGFKLNALKQLASTKSTDNKVTLLMYIVSFINSSKYQDCKNFVSDLADVPEAVRVESQAFIGDCQKVSTTMARLKKFLDDDTSDLPGDRFKSVMTSFYQGANQSVENLIAEVQNAETDTEKLAVAFGEPKGKTAWEEFFQIFKEFMESYTQAEEAVQKAEADALKEQKRKEAEDARRASKAIRVKGDAASPAGGIADALFNELVAADPKQVMEQIKARRAKR